MTNDIRICSICGSEIPKDKLQNKFCSRKCGIVSGNKSRKPRTDESRKRVSDSLKARAEELDPSVVDRRRSKPRNECSPVVKLSNEERKLRQQLSSRKRYMLRTKYPDGLRKCELCDERVLAVKKYCGSCKTNLPHYRTLCEFKFNVYEYPEEFDIELLNSLGWYSPNGYKSRNKNVNLDGVSRDHLYSVSDGFVNNKDPKILSHPANCRLIKHNGPNGNSSKNKNSILTWEKLLDRVNEWDEKYKELSIAI